jgi:hypothetical protein
MGKRVSRNAPLEVEVEVESELELEEEEKSDKTASPPSYFLLDQDVLRNLEQIHGSDFIKRELENAKLIWKSNGRSDIVNFTKFFVRFVINTKKEDNKKTKKPQLVEE